MKPLNKAVGLLLLASPLLSPLAAHASECGGPVNHVKVASLDAQRALVTNYTGSGGQFDADPLLGTTVAVPRLAKNACLVIHFSAEATIDDNAAVFEVLVDGVPATGQYTGFINEPSPVLVEAIPIIDDHNGIEIGRPTRFQHMLSYTVFARVGGGSHTVEVLGANCCSINSGPGSVVHAATLAVESP
jgi:hypothetical protein